jgi:hypothetical protein
VMLSGPDFAGTTTVPAAAGAVVNAHRHEVMMKLRITGYPEAVLV